MHSDGRSRWPGWARTAALACCLLLGACAFAPPYRQPDVDVSRPFPVPSPVAADARTAGDLAWPEVFRDPRLQQLLRLALANNADLRVAVLNVQAARAQAKIAAAALLPDVVGGAGFSRTESRPLTTQQWSASIAVPAYELDLFGRVRSLKLQAVEQYLATAEAQRAAQMSLVAEVAAQYFQLRQAEEQVALAEQTLAAVSRSLEVNRARVDAGDASEVDQRAAEGQVLQAKISINSYRRLAAQTTHALEVLIGQALPTELPDRKPFNDSDQIAALAPGMPSELLVRRPDILQAEHLLRAANANIGAARAAFFPSVTLTASAGTASSELRGLFATGSGSWSFSPQVSVPIFNAGRNRAGVRVAEANAGIRIANYQRAVQTAFREVADALVAASSYGDEWSLRIALVGAQARRLELATARYDQGEDSYLNVLSAQQDLYSAQQGMIGAQYNRLLALISLYQALGGGWQ